MAKRWAVQDAKARFSELLRAAEKEPQTISYRGEPKFEVRLKEGHPEQAAAAKGLPGWWLNAPKIKGGLKLPPRKRERMQGQVEKIELMRKT